MNLDFEINNGVVEKTYNLEERRDDLIKAIINNMEKGYTVTLKGLPGTFGTEVKVTLDVAVHDEIMEGDEEEFWCEDKWTDTQYPDQTVHQQHLNAINRGSYQGGNKHQSVPKRDTGHKRPKRRRK